MLKTELIEEANRKVIDIMLKGEPILEDIRPAIEVIPKMSKTTILHSGPPILWKDMCKAQQNAIVGGIIYERLADSPSKAYKVIERDEVTLSPCHQHSTVGGMTGVTTASMPVYVVKNSTFGNIAYSNHHEGWPVKALHWGNNDDEVIAHLRWLEEILTPVLRSAIKQMKGLNVKKIIAKALQMSDECHSRCTAGTALFVEEIVPHLVMSDLDKKLIRDSLVFLVRSDIFFLHIIMAALKSVTEPANGIEYSTIVTTQARNGVEYGIKVSALGDRWFTGPSSPVHGLYLPGYSSKDAGLDIGDSSITEVLGLGGFSIAASPPMAIMKGGTMESATNAMKQMYKITVSKNHQYTIPYLNFEGAPLGIDIRKVVETSLTPIIDTAIAHKNGGLIGSGFARAPLESFEKALEAFNRKYKK